MDDEGLGRRRNLIDFLQLFSQKSSILRPMKAIVSIVVLLFVTFLAAPTIVCILADDDSETCIVLSLDEEEIHKDIKEIKVGVAYVYEPAIIPIGSKTSKIPSCNLLRHESVFGDIFLPPPERC